MNLFTSTKDTYVNAPASFFVIYFAFKNFKIDNPFHPINFLSRWFSRFYENLFFFFFECKRFIYKLDFNIIILYMWLLVIYFRGVQFYNGPVFYMGVLYENKFMV